jgi:hypothetical protein
MGKDGVCDKCGKDYSGDCDSDVAFRARLCPRCSLGEVAGRPPESWNELVLRAGREEAASKIAAIRAERAHELSLRIAGGYASCINMDRLGPSIAPKIALVSVAIVDAVDAELKEERA